MTTASYICGLITRLSPAQACQLLYVLSAAAVLAVAAVPDTSRRLLTQYGARSSDNTAPPSPSQGRKDQYRKDTCENPSLHSTGLLYHLVSGLTSVGKIPHSWFIHFYILSLSCTIFWAMQFLSHGPVLKFVVQNQLSRPTPSMTLSQVVLVWFLMGLQGARRLYEYLVVLRPSSSKMWIIHWLLGNVFYLCTSVSVWVEGSGKFNTL
jgi:3-oxo-5-alpha-steroid 4-dehydrogenase 3